MHKSYKPKNRKQKTKIFEEYLKKFLFGRFANNTFIFHAKRYFQQG